MTDALDLTGTGLEGVSLGRTAIALVDGQNGRLIYRGYDAERLAEERRFEEVAYLLWNGRLPDEAQLAAFRARVVEGMRVPPPVHDAMRALLPDALSMDVLRTGLSSWAALRVRPEGGDAEDAIWALAAMPALVADIARLRAGAGHRRGARRARPGRELHAEDERRACPIRRRRARSTRTSRSRPSTG